MTLHLEIPESVASGLRLPPGEVASRLRVELAIALYAQEILSFGKAAELADLSRIGFAELASERGLARHYGDDELPQDLDCTS